MCGTYICTLLMGEVNVLDRKDVIVEIRAVLRTMLGVRLGPRRG